MISLWLVTAAFAAPVMPDEVVAAALSRDPAAAEARADVVVAEGELRAADGLRYDPTVEARLGFGLVQHEVSVSQPISVSGEGLAAADAAAAELRAAESALAHRELEVAAGARRLLVTVIAADAEVSRTDELVRLTRELRTAAEARLASGDAAELGVRLARLEESGAAADHLRARRDALAAREELAAVTGLPRDVEVPIDPMTAAPAPSTSGPARDRDAATAHLEGAVAALRRERAASLPPVDVGAWAQVQAGVWTVGPTVTMTLPLWARNPAGIASAEGERDVARAELDAVEARIAAARAGSDDRRSALAIVEGTSDPTPEARAALAGIDTAVEAGEIGSGDAALLRARVLDVWGRAAGARAAAAELAIDLALAEAWPTLLPGGP